MTKQQISRFDSRRLIDNREMRIFLSSTFLDMQQERMALTKTFQTLKIEAIRRNVTLSVIDLRWGITDDESQSGKVLSVCLEEIEHSHPFFIGILGDCYGSSPDITVLEKNPELEERYPWIREDIVNGLSYTEIEMQYGALRNDHDVDALFFIKNTADVQADDKLRLTLLKRQIHEQDRFPVSEYISMDDLCNRVEHSVLAVLDKHFPYTENSRLEHERIVQKSYINNRHSHYQRPEADFKRLDEFLISDDGNLVITGCSGMGKSALIANWLKEKEGTQLSHNIIYHFVGNSFSGSDHRRILQHICDELYCLYGIERREGLSESLEDEAQRILVEAGKEGKPVLIVIDGINQIADDDYSKLLNWLPQAPHFAKYLFSTLEEDETMDTFKRRGYPVHPIGTLDRGSRREFIISYLQYVGKKLSDDQIDLILDDPENENMLVLKTLLDELICFGTRKQLDEHIDYYLSSSSIDDFFDRMLQRMEDDYKDVPHILSLIALCENGITEDELQAITGLRPLDIHMFYCAFFNHFVSRDGLITFGHQYVTDAVWRRYRLEVQENARPYRQQIIDHISCNDSISKTRKISELAFQYYQNGDDKNLHKTILSFEAFRYFNTSDKGDATLALYWRKLLESDSVEQYQLQDYLGLPTDGIPVKELPLIAIAEFVYDYLGYGSISLLYSQTMLAMCGEGDGNDIDVALCHNNIGMVYSMQGHYPEALTCYLKALEIHQKEYGENHLESATSLINIGSVYSSLGDYESAMKYYNTALDIEKKHLGENDPEIATCYNNISEVYYCLGNYPKALSLLLKATEIKETALGPDHLVTATSYNNLGVFYSSLDKFSRALDYYFKALKINIRILGENHPDIAASYNNIGMAYKKLANYGKALEYLLKALEISDKRLGHNTSQTVTFYNNIGGVYKDKGDYLQALDSYFTALDIQKKILGLAHPDAATIYGNIGGIYEKLDYYSDALDFFSKALEIQINVFGEEHVEVAGTYSNIGGVHESKGDYDTALDYYFKTLAIFEKVLGKEHTDTAICYNNIGYVYETQGNYDKALEFFFKDLAICEKVWGTDHPSTATSYNNIGAVYRNKKDYGNALDYFVKALNIKKAVLGDESVEAATSYNNIGSVYHSMGDNDEALRHFLKALSIFEKVLGPEHLDTAVCYNNIAGVYKDIGDDEMALDYYLRDFAICNRVLGLEHVDTAISVNNIGEVYVMQNKYREALDCCTFALGVIESKLGANHQITQIVKHNIATCTRLLGGDA